MSARRLTAITLLCSGILALPLAAPSFADDREADESALTQQTAAFVQAVNSGTAETVAGFWTEGGEYPGGDGVTIRGTGELETAPCTYRLSASSNGPPYGMINLVYKGQLLADHPISATRFRNILQKDLGLSPES